MELVAFGDLCTMSGRNGDYFRTTDYVEQNEGIIALLPSCLQDEKIVFDDVIYLSKEAYRMSTTGTIKIGDIILCKYSKAVSPYRSAVVESLPPDDIVIVNPSLFVISDLKCNAHYLQQIISSPFFQETLNKLAKGSLGAVKSSDIAKIQIPLPDIAEQERIAERIIDYKRKHFELINLLQSEIDNRTKVLDRQLDRMIWNIS